MTVPPQAPFFFPPSRKEQGHPPPHTRRGALPARRGQAHPAHERTPTNHRRSRTNMREVIPSHPIPSGAARPLLASPAGVGHVEVARLDGSTATVDDVVRDTWTDALVVIHDGQLVEERYVSSMSARTPHLLMSVSKSIIGCAAGTLVGQGLLSPDRPVSDYVPEIVGSGYDGATVRHLLDMRTGVLFREAYTVADAEVRVMERSMGWRPSQPGDPIGAYAYLTTLGHEGPHGGQFTYRSADTDLLGWVCERASGTRMADLLSERIWVPMGAEHDAEITCDAVGTAVHDGGISATARDLARFGQLLLDDGRVGETQVVPQKWLADSWNPDPDVRAAFASSENEPVLPGGWYRNQFWFVPGSTGDVLLCLGIHGQMIHVDRATRTVAIKLSCWPEAQNGAHLIDTVRAFGAVGAQLAGTAADDTSGRRVG